MDILSEKYRKRRMTPMGAVNDYASMFTDVINLGLGDPDFNTNVHITVKAFQDALDGHTKYTDYRGDPELRQEIAAYYQTEFGIDVRDEEIFVTASGCHAMYLALEAILDDGDEVLLQTPYFTPYPQQVELAGGVPVEVPTYEKYSFQLRVEELARALTPKTKALVINTPNNPTGSCFSQQTLEGIARFAIDNDLAVIADDIYTRFSYQHPFAPIVSLPGMRDRTITINSFSKNFTMTGWRVGNIIAPPHVIEAVRQINENVVFTVPSISQRAAIHALKNPRLQDEMLNTYRQRTYSMARKINTIPNMSTIYPPMGTFYLFINIQKTGLTSEEVSERIIKEAHVLTLPGTAFGACGEGYIRIACTVGQEKLDEAVERLRRMDIFKDCRAPRTAAQREREEGEKQC